MNETLNNIHFTSNFVCLIIRNNKNIFQKNLFFKLDPASLKILSSTLDIMDL